MKRRQFIEFLGTGILVSGITTKVLNSKSILSDTSNKITGIKHSQIDNLILAEGLEYEILIKYGDKINSSDFFGYNNDYIAFLPTENKDEGILWVNHEYVDPLLMYGYNGGQKTKEQVHQEMYAVGGSLFKVKKEKDKWKIVLDNDFNKRYTAQTKIPFNWDEKIFGEKYAIGTLANCAGGVTPWGTILTCEENYDGFWGERNLDTNKVEFDYTNNWEDFYDYPPEHYGWVVEVDPMTGDAQKHIALGRCAHECATIKELNDGRIVVYTGDDKNDECLYKFISSKPKSLKEGTLYVANLEKGEWISLDIRENPILKNNFQNQTDVLIHLRKASKLVGGTKLDRPEDIEIDPITGNILVALTNNIPKNNFFGSILKISEADGNHDSLKFTSDNFLTGGEETGFACPDNLAFDKIGNLWFTTDISGSKINKAPYEKFKNNGLFVVLRSGKQAGQVIQIASGPIDSELTGPYFSEDGKTLFLCVQHPGETSKSLDNLTSHWPLGGDELPIPALVQISGKLLNSIQGIG